MSSRQRTTLLILSALVVLFILTASLSSLELKPGRVFDLRDAAEATGMSAAGPNSDLWVTFLRSFLLLCVLLLPVYIIYMLMDPKRRKRLISELIGYALFIGAILMLQNYMASRPTVEETPIPQPTQLAGTPEPQIAGEPLPDTPDPSEFAVSAAGIAIGVLLAGAAGFALWLFTRKINGEPPVLVQVAAEAEETLESLISGKDLRQTILLCYRRMTEVAVKNRGIPREASVTPSEFEGILIEKGLPAAAVRELTHIFEDVRYGDLRADENERRRATLALRTIIAACRKQEEPA